MNVINEYLLRVCTNTYDISCYTDEGAYPHMDTIAIIVVNIG